MRAARPWQQAGADEALVRRARAGDEHAFEALARRYAGYLRAQARRFFFQGGDANDVQQEGLVGLHNAVRGYRPGHPHGFHRFAMLCITRQICAAARGASRAKHRILSGAVSLDAPAAPGSARTLGETFALSHTATPEAVDGLAFLRQVEHLLSPLERAAVAGRLRNASYIAISRENGASLKAIDNALQRAKRKLRGPAGRSAAGASEVA